MRELVAHWTQSLLWLGQGLGKEDTREEAGRWAELVGNV